MQLQRVLWTAVLGLAAAVFAGAEEFEIGGPLAGVKLPLFPTRFGEAPGYPGVVTGGVATAEGKPIACSPEGLSPERLLHPDSVEHWRANDFKYLPVRALFDRQSLRGNWKAAELPGVARSRVEFFAEPLYWARRHEEAVRLDKTSPPVPVVRLKPADPAFELDFGVLEPGMYMVSVVGAVDTAELVRNRKPLVLTLSVDDGLGGETNLYRLRCGYVDQFYSVAEFYFHAPVRRPYTARLGSSAASLVPLLVHNIELHDVLAGRTLRAVKTRTTWNELRNRAEPVSDDIPPGPRLARDRELWESGLPLNAQPGIIYGMGKDTGPATKPTFGVNGESGGAIEAAYGKWEAGTGAVLATNRKRNLAYSLADYRAGRPLPEPYPFKDDGAGIWSAPSSPTGTTWNWLPVAGAVSDRVAQENRRLDGLVQSYWTKGSLRDGRDAAVLLARIAYDAPAKGMQQALSTVLLQPGAYGKDLRHRNRYVLRGLGHDPYAYFDAYDKLFPLLSTDHQLAESLGRFIPWIRSPADVVKLMDVYLVQEKAKRYLRYQEFDNNNPAFMATVAAMLGDAAVTDPWMEWLFTRTWMYPLSISGLADVLIGGSDPDGAKYIGSLYYAHVENASTSGEMLEKAIDAGANPRYDLRDPKLYPQVLAACHWFLDVRLAGLWFPRVGDVCGPVATHGNWCTSLKGGVDMEKAMRRGWRWSGAPEFAWMLKHVYGREEMDDAGWAKVEAAAAGLGRAPWTANRSRVLSNWFGVLEGGTEFDDYRFRRCAYLRIGLGYGHAHQDTLDLGVYAKGLPVTTEGGQRPGYGSPSDGASRVHNLVEVNDRGWQGHAWVTALTDADGARYEAADAVPPASFPDVSLRRRQIALIDVAEGKGARPLTPAEMHPDFSKLDPDVVTPDCYVFDVNRVAGGKIHTYCFNGNSDDEWTVNAPTNPIGKLPLDEQRYLADYPDPATCSGADAPGTVVATWRMNRFKEGSFGPEQSHARFPWSAAKPRAYTRLHLLEQEGGRILSGKYLNKAGGNGFTVMHVRHAGEAETNRVFAAVIEPYTGEPVLDSVRPLAVADNETDARKAVAVEVKTKNGHTDWLFADGRPGRERVVSDRLSVISDQGTVTGKQVRVAGEFACLSRDQEGLRLASLTGGRRLLSAEVSLETAEAERTGSVTAAAYRDLRITLDAPWPAGPLLEGRVFEIGTNGHRTTCTITGVGANGAGSELTLKRGADFYLARVLDVEPETGTVVCNLGMAFQAGGVVRGLDRNWVASNEEGTRFWRAEYKGADRDEGRYTFKLTGGPVAREDFGRLQGFRLWWFGAGDTVRQSTFASLRRLEPGVFELSADTGVMLGLKARALEVSRDRKIWAPLKTQSVGGLSVADIPVTSLDPSGRAFVRVLP
jgi:hypothetical protein